LLGASLFLVTAAFAGEKASVKVYENVKLNGKTIAPASTISNGPAPALTFN